MVTSDTSPQRSRVRTRLSERVFAVVVAVVGIGSAWSLGESIVATVRAVGVTPFTAPLDERFERAWAEGEARRGLPVGRTWRVHRALREHALGAGLVAMVPPTDYSAYASRLIYCLYPLPVRVFPGWIEPADPPENLHLVTFDELHHTHAAKSFELLVEDPEFRLWRLREEAR